MLASFFPFILNLNSYTLLFSKTKHIQPYQQVTVSLTAKAAKLLALFFKYSFLCFNTWLLDIGCYETTNLVSPHQTRANNVLWQIFTLNNTRVLLLLTNNKSTSHSTELFFRNARWLEREASEMSGWFFLNKKDRRVLFLIPVFFSTPLKKSFPVGGFFEIILCPLTSKLTYKHISWLS